MMSRAAALFRYYFNLDSDKDNEAEIVESIKKGIHFRGANLWTLIFAIIIASIGLNVNSPAIIVGAMLISPLMGPIMGIGLGIGISDFDLVRRGMKNLLIAVVFSIVTSALYFYVTPLHTTTPELLARTTPTIWDVFVAFIGGIAGVIGVTRREKGNTVPGVAIATALMPPLCTVGFGIATGHWYYSLNAFYLFFINSVFICTATVLTVRFMRFHRHRFENEARQKRMTRYMLLVAIITIVPSIWLGYRIVQKAVFENAAQRFVRREFNLANAQVVSKDYQFDPKGSKIEVLLIGDVLDSAKLDSLQSRLPDYRLRGVRLVVRQGLNAHRELDISQIKASILDAAFGNDDSTKIILAPSREPEVPDLRTEVHALFPQIAAYGLNVVPFTRADAAGSTDSNWVFVAHCSVALPAAEQRRLQSWLKARLSQDSIQVLTQTITRTK